VDSAAGDVLRLLAELKLFPRVLVGHSFGGKVVMSMLQQFGRRLPRPVQVQWLDARSQGYVFMARALMCHMLLGRVLQLLSRRAPATADKATALQAWVLDALPGEVRASDANGTRDHPRDIIAELRRMPMPVPNRTWVVDALQRRVVPLALCALYWGSASRHSLVLWS
jgi:pimeloyl-ACP methyl ester carboxylesterase